ncbi:MAG: NusG domain II-containing protein [bacterium]|nr:NusG domain II-containing protein [bacterium]
MTFSQVWRVVLSPADKMLMIALLLFSLLSYTLINRLFPVPMHRIAIVEVNGIEARRIPLSADIKPRKVSLKIDGGEAVFDVSGDKIRILPMPDEICSKHICSKKGWIDKPWDMIACLPNKIVVRILGDKDLGDIDLISR